MAISIEKDGLVWKITGATQDELEMGIAAVQRTLQSEKRGPGRPPGKTAGKNVSDQARTQKRKEFALRFLRAVSGAPGGIAASQLMTALNLPSTKAIGNPISATNRLLKELEIKPASVYTTVRKVGEEKRWFPKGRMQEAITAVEQLGSQN